jgi:ketosteroid isomerase-like protein
MSTETRDIAARLIELETRALRRWCDADPSGFLEISAEDVVYFDPFLERRLDGLPALTEYYESLRGRIRADHFELISPCVQVVGDAAVLTFNFRSWDDAGGEARWNCTEFFRRSGEDWRLIQTHWSRTKPEGT